MDNRVLSDTREFDFLDEESRQPILAELHARLLRHAASHPLTADRIRAFWEDIPIVDQLPQGPPPRICAADPGGQLVLSSGGTTGAPKTVWLTFAELKRNTRFHGKGYALAGVRADSTVATFGLPGALSSDFTVYHGLDATGCRVVPIGSVEPQAIAGWIARLAVDTLIAMPSDLEILARADPPLRRELATVKLVVTGGEALPNAREMRFREALFAPATQFRSTFQTSEAGTIGFQCRHCGPGVYHVHEELQRVEIVDRGDGGEVVVTNMDRYLMPVVRLAIGDLAAWQTERCPCGRASRRLQLLGRRPRALKFAGERLPLAVFTEAMERVGLQLDDVAVTIDAGAGGRPRLRVALAPAESAFGVAAGEFRQALLSAAPRLKAQVDAGIVEGPIFEALTPEHRHYSASGKRLLVNDMLFSKS